MNLLWGQKRFWGMDPGQSPVEVGAEPPEAADTWL